MPNVKDSELPVASALDGNEIVALVQGGASRRTTAQAIANRGRVPIQDEGTQVSAAPTAINFTGAGVTTTESGGVVNVNIPGGGGGAAARDAVTTLTISGGTVNIDCALGDFFTLTLTANVTALTFSNLPAAGRGASLALRIRQDATGGRTLSLPASFRATTGTDTVVQSAANAFTLLTITTFDQGTRWEYTMRGVAA